MQSCAKLKTIFWSAIGICYSRGRTITPTFGTLKIMLAKVTKSKRPEVVGGRKSKEIHPDGVILLTVVCYLK